MVEQRADDHLIWKAGNSKYFKVDVDSVEVAQRLDAAFNFIDADKTVEEADGFAASVLAECELYFNFFKILLGEDDAKTIFDGVEQNSATYAEIHASFVGFVKAQKTEKLRRRQNLMNEYKPE